MINGKPQAFEPCSFSHLLKPQFINNNIVTIYPKEGQVWALYSDWNAELSYDLKNCECQLVEIIGFDNGWTKVSPLVPVSTTNQSLDLTEGQDQVLKQWTYSGVS